MQALLAAAFDQLLSIRTTTTSTATALASLELLLASLAFENTNNHLESFLRLQDGFEYNLTSRLLESLARMVIQLENAIDRDTFESIRSNVGRTLALIQGLLLLHRPSQRLFARRSTLECLLAILKLMRPNPLESPLPSPAASSSSTFEPPSPTPSNSSFMATSATGTSVSLVVLDVLLCALVDRSRNIRTFEEVGGLKAVVTILKDKNVVRSVRIKVIEILYYYLLPEPTPSRRTVSTSSSHYESATPQPIELPDLLDNAMGGFIPQTPVKSRPTHRRSSSSVSAISGGSHREMGTPLRYHARTASASSFESIGEDASSPRAARRRGAEDGRGTGEDEDGTPRAAPKSHLPLNSPRRRPHAFAPTPSADATPSKREGPEGSASPSPLFLIRPIPPSPLPSSTELRLDQSSRLDSSTSKLERRDARSETKGNPIEKREAPEARGTIRRTEAEKKELLREVLGNVDALEERFKNIALGLRSE